jgi:hypothetical protein
MCRPIVRVSSASIAAPLFAEVGLRGCLGERSGGGALRCGCERQAAGRMPDPVGGGGGWLSPRYPMSRWATPVASQIPVESWAARETSSRTVVREPPQVRCKITVPSGRAIACTTPSGSARVRPCTGTIQYSRLRSPVTKSPSLGRHRCRWRFQVWVLFPRLVTSGHARCDVTMTFSFNPALEGNGVPSASHQDRRRVAVVEWTWRVSPRVGLAPADRSPQGMVSVHSGTPPGFVVWKTVAPPGLRQERGRRRCATLPAHDTRGGRCDQMYGKCEGEGKNSHPAYGLSAHTRVAIRCLRSATSSRCWCVAA